MYQLQKSQFVFIFALKYKIITNRNSQLELAIALREDPTCTILHKLMDNNNKETPKKMNKYNYLIQFITFQFISLN